MKDALGLCGGSIAGSFEQDAAKAWSQSRRAFRPVPEQDPIETRALEELPIISTRPVFASSSMATSIEN
jgi:hypothetical protein